MLFAVAQAEAAATLDVHGPDAVRSKHSGGPIGMRNGLLMQTLSSDELAMLKAMTDQFRVRPVQGADASTGSHFSAHESPGLRAVPSPSSNGNATTVGPISLMAPGGSVTASGLHGKVQLQTASGTNDGGIRLLSSWCPDWIPVCAADGHTLPSACWARSLGLAVSHLGACPGLAAHDGAGDGESRPNRAGGSSVSMVEAYLQPLIARRAVPLQPPHAPELSALPTTSPGLVSDSLVPSEVVDPVCGCPLTEAAPVCGSDGKTYDSYCWARCARTDLFHLGPCEMSGSRGAAVS